MYDSTKKVCLVDKETFNHKHTNVKTNNVKTNYCYVVLSDILHVVQPVRFYTYIKKSVNLLSNRIEKKTAVKNFTDILYDH